DDAGELEFLAKYLASASRCGHLPLDSTPDLAHHAPFFYEWLKHDTYDDYWRSRSAVDLENARVASFCVAGLYDVFLEGTVAGHRAIRSGSSSAHLTITPWWHNPLGRYVGQMDYGPDAESWWFNHRLVEFFGAHLRGDDLVPYPNVRAFVTGQDRWEEFTEWPPASEEQHFYLHSEGGANSFYGDGRLS